MLYLTCSVCLFFLCVCVFFFCFGVGSYGIPTGVKFNLFLCFVINEKSEVCIAEGINYLD